MKNQFVSYELAVKLKELGYPQDNIGLGYVLGDYYNTDGDFNGCCIKVIKDRTNKLTKAPLWQQAFDWFREKFNLPSHIAKTIDELINIGFKPYYVGIHNNGGCDYETYEQARLACLEKLIEIVSCKSEK